IDLVMTAYLLALGVVQPTTGWLADRFGRKHVFLTSLGIFTIGSLLSGLAADLPQLVLARILQGLGGGAIFPVGMAMIYEQVPPGRRGLAMGIWSLALAAAPSFGPTLGGIIVTTLGWRWLFFVNVPIGIVGVIVGARVLQFAGFRETRTFDMLGFGLVTIGLAAALYAVSDANHAGWASFQTLALVGLGGILLIAFVVHELRVPEPLIDVRMFAIPAYSVAMVLVAGMVSVTLARLVFMPLALVTVRGMSEIEVGLILTPAALTGAIAAPLAGVLTDRIGARVPVLVGLVAMIAGSLLLATLAIDTSPIAIAVFVGIQGFGNGLALTPNSVAGMNALPQRHLARGTAIRSTTRQIAASFSIALLTAYLVARVGVLGPTDSAETSGAAQDAINSIFGICAIVGVGCLLLAIRLLPHGDEMRRNTRARAVEHEDLVGAG
ncbi:MAG: DHA2 family efflux MFS transporter permease subunit, partial [Candidatus Limnocylindrales bacterium]